MLYMTVARTVAATARLSRSTRRMLDGPCSRMPGTCNRAHAIALAVSGSRNSSINSPWRRAQTDAHPLSRRVVQWGHVAVTKPGRHTCRRVPRLRVCAMFCAHGGPVVEPEIACVIYEPADARSRCLGPGRAHLADASASSALPSPLRVAPDSPHCTIRIERLARHFLLRTCRTALIAHVLHMDPC